ncbi:hypothetical protein [Pseudoneobacillus sp. C159]
MVKEILTDIKIENDSLSYINCLHAILTAADLFEGPKFLLSGMTGMCFKFSVVKGISPISIHSYGPWARDHWTAVNYLGIYNSANADRWRHRTFPLLQKKAIEKTIASIDKGIAVLYWGPPFSVIYGYDLEERIFYYQESDDFFRKGRKSHLLGNICLFDNFGINRTEFWFYQTFGEKIEKPTKAILLDSLKSASIDWNKQASGNTAFGKGAYSLLIDTLESGDFHPMGAAFTLDSYATSKADIFLFIEEVTKVFPQLAIARDQFLNINEIFQDIKKVVGFVNKYSTLAYDDRAPLIELLKEAWRFEETAMCEMEDFLKHQPVTASDLFRDRWLQGDAR